jgi:hypothetical protein
MIAIGRLMAPCRDLSGCLEPSDAQETPSKLAIAAQMLGNNQHRRKRRDEARSTVWPLGLMVSIDLGRCLKEFLEGSWPLINHKDHPQKMNQFNSVLLMGGSDC